MRVSTYNCRYTWDDHCSKAGKLYDQLLAVQMLIFLSVCESEMRRAVHLTSRQTMDNMDNTLRMTLNLLPVVTMAVAYKTAILDRQCDNQQAGAHLEP